MDTSRNFAYPAPALLSIERCRMRCNRQFPELSPTAIHTGQMSPHTLLRLMASNAGKGDSQLEYSEHTTMQAAVLISMVHVGSLEDLHIPRLDSWQCHLRSSSARHSSAPGLLATR